MEVPYFCSHMCMQVLLHWSGMSKENLLGSLRRRMQFSDTMYMMLFPHLSFPIISVRVHSADDNPQQNIKAEVI